MTKAPVYASTEERLKEKPERGLGRNPVPQHVAWRNSACQKACTDRRSLSCTIPCERLEKPKPSGGNSAHSDISNIEDVCLIYRLYLGVFGQLGWGIGVLIKDNIKSYYCPPPPDLCLMVATVAILRVKVRENITDNFRRTASGLIQRHQGCSSLCPSHSLHWCQGQRRFIQTQAYWRACILIPSWNITSWLYSLEESFNLKISWAANKTEFSSVERSGLCFTCSAPQLGNTEAQNRRSSHKGPFFVVGVHQQHLQGSF